MRRMSRQRKDQLSVIMIIGSEVALGSAFLRALDRGWNGHGNYGAIMTQRPGKNVELSSTETAE